MQYHVIHVIAVNIAIHVMEYVIPVIHAIVVCHVSVVVINVIAANYVTVYVMLYFRRYDNEKT